MLVQETELVSTIILDVTLKCYNHMILIHIDKYTARNVSILANYVLTSDGTREAFVETGTRER